MNKQNKVVNEKKQCEMCGDNDYTEMYHVIFTDGEKEDCCNICLMGYFEEIPEEVDSVKRIDPKEIILKCQKCNRIIFDLESDPSFKCPKCGSSKLEIFGDD